MSDTPKRWLIDDQGELYIMNGYADELAAVKAWAHLVKTDLPEHVRVTELKGNGFAVELRRTITAEFR